MTLSLVVATDLDGVIGQDGGLPWRLSSDLRRFRRLTTGHHLIMGRATYESIGRPLPGRTTLVLTRDPQWRPALAPAPSHPRVPNPESRTPNPAPRTPHPILWPPPESGAVLVVHDLDEALRIAAPDPEPFVVGGGQIYRLALPRVDRIHWTRVETRIETRIESLADGGADSITRFPDWEPSQWREISVESLPASERDEFPHEYRVLERQG